MAKQAEGDTATITSLDDLKKLKSSRSPKVCSGCGKEGTEASVVVQVRRQKEHLSSKSRTFCEECCIGAFDQLSTDLSTYSART